MQNFHKQVGEDPSDLDHFIQTYESDILHNLFRQQEADIQKFGGSMSNFKPLDFPPIQITKDYRTKMVDWLIEVCHQFKCSERTWFLAVEIFDRMIQEYGVKGISLENSSVHGMGIIAVYLASKFEDIYPITSNSASVRISHNMINQEEVLRREKETLALFNFDLHLLSPFDFYLTFISLLEHRIEKPRQCWTSLEVGEDVEM